MLKKEKITKSDGPKVGRVISPLSFESDRCTLAATHYDMLLIDILFIYFLNSDDSLIFNGLLVFPIPPSSCIHLALR